jgi:hypothetical protein
MRIEAAAQAASGSEIPAVLDALEHLWGDEFATGYDDERGSWFAPHSDIKGNRMTQRLWAHAVAVTAASSPPAGDAA